jgi:rod shape determining protein RodA
VEAPVASVDRRLLAHFDWALALFTLLIPLCGLVVLYSAGYDADNSVDLFGLMQVSFPSTACLKQLSYLLAGLVVMTIGLSIPTRTLHRYSFALYAAALLLLVAVAGFGVVVNGSRRWLNLGGFNLQPSEFMKLGLIVTMARVLAKRPPKDGAAYRLPELILPAAVIALPMILIARQPDLGTALSLAVVGVAQILFMGVRPRSLLTVVVAVLILAYPAWEMLHDYQQRRILVLLDPESDPKGSGYHITQSKIAVGSGELFGKGYRQGTQTQLEFLPEHTTDFVFSVLAEEWGFVGSVVLISLFFGLFVSMLRIAARTRDLFACLVAFGITAQIFAHVVINIGMVIGLMPVVGIPLPLVSYGGSSMLSLLFGIGIVQGVSMRRLQYRPS